MHMCLPGTERPEEESLGRRPRMSLAASSPGAFTGDARGTPRMEDTGGTSGSESAGTQGWGSRQQELGRRHPRGVRVGDSQRQPPGGRVCLANWPVGTVTEGPASEGVADPKGSAGRCSRRAAAGKCQ